MRFFRNWWFITITITLLLIGLVSFGLPILVDWLSPWWVRLLTGGTIFLIWAILAFLRVRRARKAAKALEETIVEPDLADEESKALAARVKASLGELKKNSGKRGNYLYERPWYMIIGPPGAGKTTALLNSGLQFPDSVREERGIGGTRNLDFLFADEAVIVDTAGRYTTQDTDYKVDAAGWKTFLSLLRKNRPLQPINGVIVTIGVDELISNDCAKIDDHARTIRRRLMELRQELQSDVPVYVMMTKADKLAGFMEYFADLDIEGRRAVLGHTLKHTTAPVQEAEIMQGFDRMSQSITDRQAKRLFEETDPTRRSLIMGFPSQLQSLRTRLMRLLDGIFVSGQERPGMLRGFYLTSGLQEGTPLDRILSGMADVFDREQQPVGGTGTAGKAYFLNRLLSEVMFAEAGLVTMDTKARTRQRVMLASSLAGVAIVSLLVLGLWTVSFVRNQSFQSDLLEASTELEPRLEASGIDMQQYRSSDPDLRQALPYLNALRELPYGHAAREAGDIPWSMRFGLFQNGLSRQAEETYLDALRRIMLPRLIERMELYLQTEQDPMLLYEPLKVYLMVGQVENAPFDKDAISSWIVRDWAENVFPGSDAQAQRAQLEQHLASLLEYDDRDGAWENRRPDVDMVVVADARQAVTTLSMAQRSYAMMKQRALAEGSYWTASTFITDGEALAFADPDAVRNYRVPEFFTREGYDGFQARLIEAAATANDDLWVFGEGNQAGLQQETVDLTQGIAGAYATDYVAAWQGLIDAMAPANYFGSTPEAQRALGALTRDPSPLKKLLWELRKNTTFEGGLSDVVEGVAERAVQRSSASRMIADAGGGDSGLDAGATIVRAFRDIHEYVGDPEGEGEAPIDEFLAALEQAGTAVGAAENMGGAAGFEANQADAARAAAALQTAASRAPQQMQEFVRTAASSSRDEQISSATGAISEVYGQEILPRCQEVALDRYPFSRSSAVDAAPVQMREVFGFNGLMENFVSRRLYPMIDSSGPVWRWRGEDQVANRLDPLGPEEFARALEIRDFLSESFRFRVTLLDMGDEVSEVRFSTGSNAPVAFTSTAGPARPMVWDLYTNVGEAFVELNGVSGETGQMQTRRRFDGEGAWALFRLVQQARKENAGSRAITLQFGERPRFALLRLELPGETDPFSQGGLWSFRCPASL